MRDGGGSPSVNEKKIKKKTNSMTTKKIITETNLKGWKVVGKKMREDQFNQRVDWFAILFCFSVFVKFLCSSDTG